MNLGFAALGLSVVVTAYGQGAPSGGHGGIGHGGAGRPAGHVRGSATMPRSGSIAGPSPNVNHLPADVTGKTFPAAQSSFSRSYVASAPYLNPTPIEAFPGSSFAPGALPQRPTGNLPKWMYRNGRYWMPAHAGHAWGPFENGYQFAGQGYWGTGYGYYPYGWGGDGSFLIVGDSALRAWAGEPVDGYPPEAFGPGGSMPMVFSSPPALPEGMAFAPFTGLPETIVLDFPPGSRVRR